MKDCLTSICMICNQQKQEGIRIVSEFICEACEKEMIETDAQDVRYLFFVRQMKQLYYTNQV
ncbi:Inhibitor of sigma-G Gin [compost metagenome]